MQFILTGGSYCPDDWNSMGRKLKTAFILRVQALKRKIRLMQVIHCDRILSIRMVTELNKKFYNEPPEEHTLQYPH